MRNYRSLTIIFFVFLTAFIFSPFLDLVLNYLLNTLGIYSAIVIGFFYSFIFTSGASAVMLSNIKENFLVFSLLAAFGSMLADLTIIKIIRTNLKSEIDNLAKVFNTSKLLGNKSFLYNKKVQLLLGFLIIGSPLPDELGLLIMRKDKLLNTFQFICLCFVSNFIFIYFISRFL